MKKYIKRVLLGALSSLLGLATVGIANQYAQAGDPTTKTAALPEVDKDDDEFYAHVDNVTSPTELMVTVLDVWNPMDKLHGPRWPDGVAKVKPTKRAVILEDIAVPNNADQKKSALEFISKALKESGNEVICTGSSVSVRKELGGEVICITGYVILKNGTTLNNALVRQGLATTTSPIYKVWQEEAKKKKLGIWRDQK